MAAKPKQPAEDHALARGNAPGPARHGEHGAALNEISYSPQTPLLEMIPHLAARPIGPKRALQVRPGPSPFGNGGRTSTFRPDGFPPLRWPALNGRPKTSPLPQTKKTVHFVV
uniref:Uncharacterized protein n=1 Tax=Magnetospirillum gryphiswaldense TaxID=55518 RepID=A4U3B4_9PROT|nr:hypothetical protein MGR_0243 [Magnetospirillum gryphiswaldense MSR-1]